jgi:hypothetical protein
MCYVETMSSDARSFAIPGLLKSIHMHFRCLVSLAILHRDRHHQLTKGDVFFIRATAVSLLAWSQMWHVRDDIRETEREKVDAKTLHASSHKRLALTALLFLGRLLLVTEY